MISFLRDVFTSVRLSGSILGTLLELATRFSDGEFSVTEVSISPETNSATAFLFWLLVVIFIVEKWNLRQEVNSSKKIFVWR